MPASKRNYGGRQPEIVGDRIVEDPEERGQILAAIPRGKHNGEGEHMEEFRVVLDEYKGHLFLNLRLWQRSGYRNFFPVAGKGCTVRLHEAAEVAAALLEAVRLAEAAESGYPPAPRETPRQPSSRQPAAVNPSDRPLLGYAPGRANFDETEGHPR